MRLALIVLTVQFVFISISYAANINSASCSQADVQAAITAASPGDKVIIPSGRCSWSTTVTLNKKLTLQGAGTSNTIITVNSNMNINTGGSFRITGIQFIPTYGLYTVMSVVNASGWRVDHCSFIYSGTLSVQNSMVVTGAGPGLEGYGVFDHNTLVDVRTPLFYGSSCNFTDNVNWADNLMAGTANALYMEDNTINNGGHGYNTIPDANCGARVVFRNNKVNGYGAALHGNQTGGNRATRLWEIYNNVYSSVGYSTFVPIWLRGGTGYVYNNTIGDGFSYSMVLLDNQRSRDTVGGMIECDGTQAEDGNRAGQYGYPCRDQIGRSADAGQWTVGNPNPQQSISPAYMWNNLHNGIGVTVSTDGNRPKEYTYHIVANRDYYNMDATNCPANPAGSCTAGVGVGTLPNRPSTCTHVPVSTGLDLAEQGNSGVGYWATDTNTLYRCSATNTWTVQYKPYTYPHPLTGTQPPQNVRMIN